MMKACEKNNVIWMDGVMFMHSPRLDHLSRVLSDPLLESVQRVESSFCFHGNKEFMQTNIRANASCDPLGCLGDLGWYNIRLAILAFSTGGGAAGFSKLSDCARPRSAKATCSQWTSDGLVPLDCACSVSFCADGWEKRLDFSCSFVSVFRQRFEIYCFGLDGGVSGDRQISCDDFVIPRVESKTSLRVESFIPGVGSLIDVATRVASTVESLEATSCIPQEALMFQCFRNLMVSKINGNNDADRKWRDLTILTQAIIDACFVSMKLGGEETAVVL